MIKLKIIRIFLTVFLTVFVAVAKEFALISAMHESGSIVNTTFFNAGAALPTNASSMSLNPAIPAAWHYFSRSRMSVFGIYSSNNDNDFYKTGGGGSLALGPGQYVGLEYNLKKETGETRNRFHRATLAGGSLVGETDFDALFFGYNISFFGLNGTIPKISEDDINVQNNLVAADLGFYQIGDEQGLSWGLVLENILGYSWDIYDKEKSHNFIDKRYNSFLLAASLSVPVSDKMLLTVPADLRFWGFMNRDLRRTTKLKHRTEIMSGLELQLGQTLCGRFGWAWTPYAYTTDEDGQLNYKGWDNRFNGGLGVNAGHLSVDLLWGKETWGVGLSFQI